MRVERAPAAATACSRGSAASLRAPTCTVNAGAAGEGAGSVLYAAGESGLSITGRYPAIITSLEILLPSSIVITAGALPLAQAPRACQATGDQQAPTPSLHSKRSMSSGSRRR